MTASNTPSRVSYQREMQNVVLRQDRVAHLERALREISDRRLRPVDDAHAAYAEVCEIAREALR